MYFQEDTRYYTNDEPLYTPMVWTWGSRYPVDLIWKGVEAPMPPVSNYTSSMYTGVTFKLDRGVQLQPGV